MRGTRVRIAAAGAIALAGAIGIAVAMAVSNPNVKGKLSGYQEVPAVSSDAAGSFEAKVSKGDNPIRYELKYRGVPEVNQAHLHFGQTAVNGGIFLFICTNLGNGPVGTPECPPGSATLTGTATSDDVVGGAAGQGIAAGELDEVKDAIRAGAVYANVHTEGFPNGEIRAQLRSKK
jgi:CHRD domain